MSATGAESVKFYAVFAKNVKIAFNRYKKLNIAELVKGCDDNVDKVLTVVGELLEDEQAAKAIAQIVAGYNGVELDKVTPPLVLQTVLKIASDEDTAEALSGFLSSLSKMQA